MFTYCSYVLIYCSKTQTVISLSSIEAKFVAPITAAKTTRYLQSILTEFAEFDSFPDNTVIYEDNISTIMIVNALLMNCPL